MYTTTPRHSVIPRRVLAFMAARNFAMSAFMPTAALVVHQNGGDMATACGLAAVGIMASSLSDAVSRANKLNISDYCPDFTTEDCFTSAGPATMVSIFTTFSVVAALKKYSIPTIIGAAAIVLATNTAIWMYQDLTRKAVLQRGLVLFDPDATPWWVRFAELEKEEEKENEKKNE